jgi:uncharacterized protein YqgC (DUF456 family)
MPQVDSAVQVLALILAVVVMAFGTFAAVLPVVPGPALVWTAATVYALVTGFRDVTALTVIILTVLMIVGSTTDFWMGLLGAKVTGGSIWGALGSIAGMIIGLIIFFPIGGIIGGVLGALIIELVRTGDLKKALRIGGGTFGGYLLGVLAEFTFALVMDIIFAVSLFLAHRS